MSLFVRSLEPPEGLYLCHSAARPKTLHGKCLSSGLRGPILKEPQCGNIGKQIESTLNCENPPAAEKHAAIFNFPDYSLPSRFHFCLLAHFTHTVKHLKCVYLNRPIHIILNKPGLAHQTVSPIYLKQHLFIHELLGC